MRELKFRLYFHDKELNRLQYSTHKFEVTDKQLHVMLARFDENTIKGFVQFTGLKDKNGKDIYEGDVINGRNQVLKVVKWDAKRAAFVYIEQFKPKTVRVSFAQMYDKFRSVFYKNGLLLNHEVIGNIYENPELL